MPSRKLIQSLIGVVALFTLAPLMSAQSTFQTLFDFDLWDGKAPRGGLVFDNAGNLYSTTWQGGKSSEGVIFKLAPNADRSWTQTILHNFTGGLDGAMPFTSLTFDQAGNLYGTTESGGASGHGVVFQLVPNSNGTWTENVLHSFTIAEGGSGGVIFDQAGNLYGTTGGGSTTVCPPYGCGVVFKLAPNSDGSWSESTIYAFCSQKGCRDGAGPGNLVFDQAGTLYGTSLSYCPNGGNSCGGTVFKLSPNADGSWTESVLHHFCSWGSNCKDGAGPYSVLLMDQAGNFFGTTEFGGAFLGGVVFELSPNADGSWSEKVLHNFPPTFTGDPQGQGLVLDSAGNLYGTNVVSGPILAGLVFKLSPNSNGEWPETVLHAFQGTDGAGPYSPLVFDPAGHLFGATIRGGANGYGTVFEITP